MLAQEAEYKALVRAQEAAIAALREGEPMGGAQTAAIDALKVGSSIDASLPAYQLCGCISTYGAPNVEAPRSCLTRRGFLLPWLCINTVIACF